MAGKDGCPVVLDNVKITVCQMCGTDKQSCCDHRKEINYQKQVDPPIKPYSQLLPDSTFDKNEKAKQKQSHGGSDKQPFQICVPISLKCCETHGCSKKLQSEPVEKERKCCDPHTCPKKLQDEQGEKERKCCEAHDCPKNLKAEQGEKEHKCCGRDRDKNKESEKDTGLCGSSTVTKASCLPSCPPPPVKMMLCLPCPPPESVVASTASSSCPGKPTDYTYRCESRELRGGQLYSCCQCIKRNGLQHDCPRTPCQGRPPCLTKPWPDCWPSGGCHGIDYSREKGYKRYNPCHEQRFDKKVCEPPGKSGGRADCGGNMMVVVCPAAMAETTKKC